MKDFFTVFLIVLVLIAAFYAFQIIVMLIVGAVLYYTLPTVLKIMKGRPTWK